ncbi:hypothetical protein A4G26_05490 [Mycobacterium kansasii]|uniref:PE-PGRS family protein PE_PGRS17 n=1 Tax=Mycobacterium innocens TaxID=2341083 RepID=A0A498PQV8_9MYCO|nr:hypothetical protein A4G26_05490 [Mycobacterium kansasii]VBA36013.1 PE-PGRS family protein PE_PGRS17 [Mycobacterium innocens]
MQVQAAAADEISTAVAALFGRHALAYRQAYTQARAFHERFVQALAFGGSQYASAEAANVEQTLLDAINGPTQFLLGRPLIGNGADGTATSPNGGAGGLLYGNGGAATAVGGSGGAGGAGDSAGLWGSGGDGGMGAAGAKGDAVTPGGSGGAGGAGGNAGWLGGTAGAGGNGGNAASGLKLIT